MHHNDPDTHIVRLFENKDRWQTALTGKQMSVPRSKCLLISPQLRLGTFLEALGPEGLPISSRTVLCTGSASEGFS